MINAHIRATTGVFHPNERRQYLIFQSHNTQNGESC